MSELLLRITDELGIFLEQFEAFIINLSSGTNFLFIGLMIVSVIGLIIYFVSKTFQIKIHT